ncbi:hypothetical protein [Parasutterella muris]|uniref:hypothetical protein n=1 Tax=Parasutterella muris TaxID=2565572 RepID=UPI002042197F|nr:hypothetical protein [Parasutterella muris]
MFEKRAKQYLREKNARSNATNASVNAHRQPRLEKRAESQHIRAKIKALDKLSGVINDMQKMGASDSLILPLQAKYFELANSLADEAIAS